MFTLRLHTAFIGATPSVVTGTVGARGRRVGARGRRVGARGRCVLVIVMYLLSVIDASFRVAVVLSLVVEHICQQFDVL